MGNVESGLPGVGGGAGGGGGGGFDTAHSFKDPDPASFLPGGVPVYVNVYHLIKGPGPTTAVNGALLGLGAFHSGVEVHGREWSFGGDPTNPNRSGVFPAAPKNAMPGQLHRTHYVGNLPRGHATTAAALEALAVRMGNTAWTCGSYNLLSHNCNHFAEAFVQELNALFMVPNGALPLVYPGYINRAAKLGSGLVPPQLLAALERSTPKPPGGDAGGNASQQQQPPQQQPQQQQQQQRTPAEPAAPRPASTPTPQRPESRPSPQPARGTQQAPQQPPRAAAPSSSSSSSSSAGGSEARGGRRRYTREELEQMPLKELRRTAEVAGVQCRGLLEKPDFVAAVLAAA